METLTNWDIAQREDLRMIPEMKNNGWQVIFHDNDRLYNRTTLEKMPMHSVSFHKGIIRIWQCREGWQTTQLIGGSFINHGGATGIKDGALLSLYPNTKGFIPSLKECLNFFK